MELTVQEVEKLFSSPCEFVAGAQNLSQVPDLNGLPEVAFVGRSNVGKSSIINSLVNRKSLVRVSSNPGCTRQMNFFNLNNKLILVDLPGYGFAKISKKESHEWNNTITRYLKGRREMQKVFVLVDSRHGLKDTDRQIVRFLDDSAMSYHLVLTKSDKTNSNDLQKVQDQIKSEMSKFTALYPEMLVTSVHDSASIMELRNEIAKASFRYCK